MENGTPNGETAPIEPVSNNAPTVTTPVTPTVDPQLTEALKKVEQAEMRARQLENEKAIRDKADEATRQQQLEEQNEFKTLYEREKETREQLERDKETSTKQASIDAAKADVLKDYSPEVKDIADTAGLSLTDDTPEAQAELKTKLDSIAAKLPQSPPKRVLGNNGPATVVTADDAEKAKLYHRMRFTDKSVSEAAKSTVINGLTALNEMRHNAGLNVEE